MNATMTQIEVGSRVAVIETIKPVTYPAQHGQPKYTSTGGRFIRVGTVVEVNGDRVRVKWEYKQFNDQPKNTDTKRTWMQAKKLTTTFTENN